jgi:hypothetical protein
MLVSCTQRRLTKSTLLGGLRSQATRGNAGPHSGECKIHGKDGVAGSIRRGLHTKPAARAGSSIWPVAGQTPPTAACQRICQLDLIAFESMHGRRWNSMRTDPTSASTSPRPWSPGGPSASTTPRGDALLAPSITHKLINRYVTQPLNTGIDTGLEELTNREREAVVLVGAVVLVTVMLAPLGRVHQQRRTRPAMDASQARPGGLDPESSRGN